MRLFCFYDTGIGLLWHLRCAALLYGIFLGIIVTLPSLYKIAPLLIIEEQNAPQKQERLSENVLISLKNRLLDLMQNEKIYLEDDLNLPKLAQKMTISTHDLSYLLNVGFGKSFFQFINDYRIEAAKKLLASEKNDHLNMVGIAYAAGFSSKTTFYTAFKKATNQSPSEFQNVVRKQH